MPVYGYCCETCSNTFDVLKKMDAPDPTDCPSCGGAVKRQLGAPHFRLVGGGWYETDFKGKSEPRRHLADASSPSASSSPSPTRRPGP